ncbi:MAG: PD-(D/E)XK nuclease family protein, partial [Patescibacteria group bacterium]|nr:PD-(D/E)XK nuclease family protein [Patescibacteria group bacterium]
GYGLSEALRHLDILERYGVSLRSGGEAKGPPGVVLLTAHKAKGLEFSHVFIVRAAEGHWGGRRVVEHFPPMRAVAAERGARAASESSAENELCDERRLFYVALTRARESVTITHARAGDDGRARLPSRFLEEIDPAHLRRVDTALLEESLERERRGLFGARELSGRLPALSDRAFLRERFRTQGLSVTAINNYLACPWRYFFENLIRVPRAPNRHQLYGIAVHSALREMFDALGRETKMSEKEFLASFERALARTPLSEGDFAVSKEKGRRALSGYYRAYEAVMTAPLRTEMRIGGVAFEGAQSDEKDDAPPRVMLVGVLDKVELFESGSNRLLVTDYKTGRPRSRNDIEGKTKTSQGEYKRQLVFYKLLLDRFEEGRFKMHAGEIDFVEPDARGRYHRERFEISGEDVMALAAEIERVVRDIWSLSFWERRCEERGCEYCALRELMGGAL